MKATLKLIPGRGIWEGQDRYIIAENDPLEIAVSGPVDGLYAVLISPAGRYDVKVVNGALDVPTAAIEPGKLCITLRQYADGREVQRWTVQPLYIVKQDGEYRLTPFDLAVLERLERLETAVYGLTPTATEIPETDE